MWNCWRLSRIPPAPLKKGGSEINPLVKGVGVAGGIVSLGKVGSPLPPLKRGVQEYTPLKRGVFVRELGKQKCG